MHAHREQGEQQQRDRADQQADRAGDHDGDFRGLDDSYDPRLVMGVGELAGERRKEKERQDEQAAGDRVERSLARRILVEVIGDQHHHRGLEQIVVECPEGLGGEQGQETPLGQQDDRGVHLMFWLGLVRDGLHSAPPLAADWGRVQYREVPRCAGMD